jgi:hypothetical protein
MNTCSVKHRLSVKHRMVLGLHFNERIATPLSFSMKVHGNIAFKKERNGVKGLSHFRDWIVWEIRCNAIDQRFSNFPIAHDTSKSHIHY